MISNQGGIMGVTIISGILTLSDIQIVMKVDLEEDIQDGNYGGLNGGFQRFRGNMVN